MKPFLDELRPQDVAAIFAEFERSYAIFREKRDRALSRRPVTPDDIAMFKKLDGIPSCTIERRASEESARHIILERMLRGFETLRESDEEAQFLHVTIIPASTATSDEKTTINLRRLVSVASSILSEMSSDWSASIEIQGFSNHPHPLGGQTISPHVHAVVYGDDVFSHAQKVAQRKNDRMRWPLPGCAPVDVELVRPNWIDLARVVRYPFKAVNRLKNIYVNTRNGRTNINESEAPDRYVRYLRLFQILSLIPQAELMFAKGRLQAVHEWALGDTIEPHWPISRPCDHLSVEHLSGFWNDFMWRVGLSRFDQPLIRYRNEERL